jgi:hypothetical protein
MDTSSFADYANVQTRSRVYPTYSIDPELNFPPKQDYAARAVAAYNGESIKLDAIMFRITDRRHTDAIIAAHQRGVAVRLIVDAGQYRNPKYLWDAWNVDRLYAAGVSLKWQGHTGENHEKLVLLYRQNLSIFGSSNWTTASANKQQEHNYFTTKLAIFHWFATQFERMWNNANPSRIQETEPFAPSPPDVPRYKSPAAGAAVTTSTATLTWNAGPWAHKYDIYFGTSATPPLIASNIDLGPSENATDYVTYRTPTLTRGRTYYWKVVSRTMANVKASGAVRSFTAP